MSVSDDIPTKGPELTVANEPSKLGEITIERDCWVTSIGGMKLEAPMWCPAGTVLKIEPVKVENGVTFSPTIEWFEP